MGTQASSTFRYDSWEENPYVETEEGGKLSRASVKQAISGDIEGRGEVEWLMCYRPDQTADFVGLQRVVGALGGRSGSFVLESSGTYDGTEARGALTVVRGSGTGDLAGIVGRGEFRAPHGPEAQVSLDYDFE
jgi:Protein of unknown function (DUF3224)